MGFFSVSKAVLVPGEPNALGVVGYTVEELHVVCSVVGASPAFYVEAGELEPVWVFDISFLGEVRSYEEFFGQSYDFETRLGTYDRGAGEEHEIGSFNTLYPEANNIIKMTLSASAFHEDF